MAIGQVKAHAVTFSTSLDVFPTALTVNLVTDSGYKAFRKFPLSVEDP